MKETKSAGNDRMKMGEGDQAQCNFQMGRQKANQEISQEAGENWEESEDPESEENEEDHHDIRRQQTENMGDEIQTRIEILYPTTHRT